MMSSREINTFSKKTETGRSREIKLDSAFKTDLLKKFKRNEKYEHITVVGKGGMGTITLSRDKNTLRKVAVKTLNKDLLKNHEAVIRFTEEAQITAQLEHPNIIPVYEMGLDKDDAPFYTMKYVKGTNLKEILRLLKEQNDIILQKFHIIELLNIFIKVCDAMSFACSKGVLHRDLKPENIMIGEFGEVLVVDWGLAKTFCKNIISDDDYSEFNKNKLIKNIDSFIQSNIDTIRSINNVSLSIDNCLIGTPQYMAPERIIGSGDEKSEIFALGTILFDILALSNMFTASEVKEVLKKVASGDSSDLKEYKNLPHISGGKVPKALMAVVQKATQLNPDQRYQNINEFKNEIESYILGYATKAESAGFFRLLKLGLIRHKKISFFITAALISILAICSVFIYELIHSRQDALNKSNYASFLEETAKRKSYQVTQKSEELKNKIAELKSHTQIIIGNALHEADQLNFEKALNYIHYALDLDPDNEVIYWHLGRIYLTILSFDQAIESFEKIKTKKNLILKTKEFLDWSQLLSAKVRSGAYGDEDIIGLYNFLKSKGEYSESIAVLNQVKSHPDFDRLLTEIWKLRLERSQLKAAINDKGTKFIANNGKFKITFDNVPLFDLSPIIKMPVSDLSISNCRINNIDALKDMPLESLSLNNTGVTSLEPLSKKKLVELKLKNLKLSDLSPLKGMSLNRLSIINCPVENLTPLQDMLTLNYLVIEKTLVSNLAPLKGMRLKTINAQNTRIKNIGPLRGMPLRTILLNSTPINNISALKFISPQTLELSDTLVTELPELNTSKLEKISLNNSPIKNINPLKSADKLTEIGLSNTQVINLSALQGKPLETVHITGTAVQNIAPISNRKLKYLYLTGSQISDIDSLSEAKQLEKLYAGNCGIKDISALKNLPLKELELSGNINIQTIEALDKAHLNYLKLDGTSVIDLSPIKNQNIRKLELKNCNITSLETVSNFKNLLEINLAATE